MDNLVNASSRDKSRDGLRNKVESFVLTHGEPLWRFVNASPSLARKINGLVVKSAVGKAGRCG